MPLPYIMRAAGGNVRESAGSLHQRSLLRLLLAEGKKALAEVVEHHKQAHARQHGQILRPFFRQAGEDQPHERLGKAIGKAVAHAKRRAVSQPLP